MEQQSDGISTYKQVKVNTAQPGKIIVMLYDELLKQIDLATQRMGEGVGSLDMVNTAILKAHDIVTELTVSLDMEKGGEIATQLYNLYDFFGRQLIQSNVKKDPSILQSIRLLIAKLRDSWNEIASTPAPQSASHSFAVDING